MRATLGRWRKGEGGWGEDEGNSRKMEEGRRWEGRSQSCCQRCRQARAPGEAKTPDRREGDAGQCRCGCGGVREEQVRGRGRWVNEGERLGRATVKTK
jgi:hypothetical protein